MGFLSKLFGSRNADKNAPIEQEVEVHFAYGSTNFQHVYALGDQIQAAIVEAKVGEYDGHALPADGSEGRYFIFGPDSEAIYKVIEPILAASPLMLRRKTLASSRRPVKLIFPANPLPYE